MTWVFASQSTNPDAPPVPAPEELLAARVCERFHLSIEDYEANDLRYEIWYAMLALEERSRDIRDRMFDPKKSLTAEDNKWLAEWFEFVPQTFSWG